MDTPVPMFVLPPGPDYSPVDISKDLAFIQLRIPGKDCRLVKKRLRIIFRMKDMQPEYLESGTWDWNMTIAPYKEALMSFKDFLAMEPMTTLT